MRERPATDAPVDVSVIVCTWNNSRRLALTLDAIGRCTIPPTLRWELVLVDNNCGDDTAAIARLFQGRLPLVYVEERRQGLSHARNAGVRNAAGHLLIFTDDDITPCQDWILIYERAHRERPDGFYFGSPLTPDYETAPPEPELFRLASFPITGLDWGRDPRLLASHERFLGANWACPIDALRLVGGFDVRLGLDASLGKRRVGEEWDLMERLRRRGILPWYLPDAAVAHFVPAKKCRLPYIAGGWEAHGHYAALCSATVNPFLLQRPHLRSGHDGSPQLAGAPCRAYGEAVRFGPRWLMARWRGGNGYEAYASWRFYLGVIKGSRERRRGALARERLSAGQRPKS